MKFSQTDKIKRLAIYFFYDRDGIVDDYIPTLLEDLSKNVEELLVVCNGKLSIEGKAKLSALTSHILVRENTGLDVWAYKAGMEHYGWDKLGQYDEVVLLNFTLMGPLYPFKEMFTEMSGRDVDFWGITRHYGMDFDPWGECKYGYIPMHIQNCFMVIRSSMLKSRDFQEYWEKMPMIHNYGESIGLHEVIFTKDFMEKGFIGDTYIDTEDLKEYSNYPLMLYPTELIAHRKCPVFKRKMFYNIYDEFIGISCGEPGYELYQYLAEKTNYDLNLIWETVLRTANLADVKERMQLNYLLPGQARLPNRRKRPRVALFMHIFFMEQVEYCKRYADSMPFDADIYLTTDTEEKKQVLEKAFREMSGRKVHVVLVRNRGREVSAHFIGLGSYAGQYDLICFAHDIQTKRLEPHMKAEAFSYHCYENVLATRTYVENILTTFQENPRLGMLVPPTPVHSDFHILLGNEWQKNFENTGSLARLLKLQVDIDQTKPPVAPIGGMYWYRPEALSLLFQAGIMYEMFPEEPVQDPDGTILRAFECIYPFVAQQSGYYTGWVVSDTYSKMELTNLYKILGDFNKTLIQKYGLNSRYTYMDRIAKSSEAFAAPKRQAKQNVKNLIQKLAGGRGIYYARKLLKLLQPGSVKNT